MIDFEKEEFLQRLDVRLYAISGMLEYHEKQMANILCSNRKYNEAQRNIEKMRRDFLEYIAKTDRKIRENFERLIKEMKTDEEAAEARTCRNCKNISDIGGACIHCVTSTDPFTGKRTTPSQWQPKESEGEG